MATINLDSDDEFAGSNASDEDPPDPDMVKIENGLASLPSHGANADEDTARRTALLKTLGHTLDEAIDLDGEDDLPGGRSAESRSEGNRSEGNHSEWSRSEWSRSEGSRSKRSRSGGAFLERRCSKRNLQSSGHSPSTSSRSKRLPGLLVRREDVDARPPREGYQDTQAPSGSEDVDPAPAPPTQLQPSSSARGVENGVILSIQLESIQCHENLYLELGRHANFIIGPNGSGKSAILTSIVVALGGKRGGARSLITDGREQGKITLCLCDVGADAFGASPSDASGSLSSVRVECTLSRTRSGVVNCTYKINGVAVSKSALSALCDRFGILVDNPCIVLQQSKTTELLTASALQKSLYAFFMEATNLAAPAADIEVARLKRAETQARVGAYTSEQHPKSRSVPLLRTAYVASAAVDSQAEKVALTASTLAGETTELVRRKHACARLEAESARRRVSLLETEVAPLRATAAKAEETLATCLARDDATRAEHARRQADMTDSINEKRRARKAAKNKLEGQMQLVNEAKAALKDALEGRNVPSAQEGAARAQAARVAAAKAELEALKAAVAAAVEESARAAEAVATAVMEADDAERSDAKATAQAALEHAREQLRLTEENATAEQRLLQRFHRLMPALVAAIAQEGWPAGEEPIGPLGAYVRIAPPAAEFGHAIERALGGRFGLGAFVVPSLRAEIRLRSIVERVGRHHGESFEVRAHVQPLEPRFVLQPRAWTAGRRCLLNAISVERDAVFNCLANHSRLESTVLVADYEDAKAALLLDSTGSLYGDSRFAYEPNARRHFSRRNFGGSEPADTHSASGLLRHAHEHLAQAELSARRQAEEAAVAACEAAISRVQAHVAAARRHVHDAKAALLGAREAESEARRRLDAAQQQFDQLVAEAEEISRADSEHVSTSDLQERLEAAEREYGDYAKKLDEATRLLEAEKEKQKQELEAPMEASKDDVEKAKEGKTRAAQALKRNVVGLRRAEEELAEKEAALKSLEQQLAEMVAEAGPSHGDHPSSSESGAAPDAPSAAPSDAPSAATSDALARATSAARAQEEAVALAKQQLEAEESKLKGCKRELKQALHAVRRDADSGDRSGSGDGSGDGGAVTTAKLKQRLDEALQAQDERAENAKAVKANVQTLEHTVEEREENLNLTLANRVTRASDEFTRHLSSVGIKGSLRFDHEEKTLHMEVSTGSAHTASTATGGVRGLSGGERAITITSFLLSLWQFCESPFRALDEPDAQCDETAHRAMLRMFLRAFCAQRTRQFIVLSPKVEDYEHALKVLSEEDPAEWPDPKIIHLQRPTRCLDDSDG